MDDKGYTQKSDKNKKKIKTSKSSKSLKNKSNNNPPGKNGNRSNKRNLSDFIKLKLKFNDAIYENEENKYFYSKNDKICIKKKSRMNLNSIYSYENKSENNYENENSKKFNKAKNIQKFIREN